MLVLLSPSKTLAENPLPLPKTVRATIPALLKDTAILATVMQQCSVAQLETLMRISPKIAALNYTRFQNFNLPFSPDNATPAIRLFKGDVYAGLMADDFSKQELMYAQTTLRILSGLYGVLKPLDLIQPYRLEMGTKLLTDNGKNLYDFWGERILRTLLAEKPDVILNLASEEYAKALPCKHLNIPMIECVFKEKKGKDYKIIGLFAKKARGMMARYIVQRTITHPQQLQSFNEVGYHYHTQFSNESRMVFVR